MDSSSNIPSHRPITIAELGAAARNHKDECPNIKAYLRLADQLRREGKDLADAQEYESAFVAFARAASIVLEKIPSHKDYTGALKQQQRMNLTLNGQEMLDSLGSLKPILVDRYDKWAMAHPNEKRPSGAAASKQEIARYEAREARRAEISRKAPEDERRDMEKKIQDEAALWRHQREDAARKDEDDRRQGRESRSTNHVYSSPDDRRAQALQAASTAAGLGSSHTTVAVAPSVDREAQRRQQEAMARKEAEIRRQQQHAGIVSRHQEAENTARAERQNIEAQTAPYRTTPSGIQMPAANPSYPQMVSNSSYADPHYNMDSPSLTMPLESPTKYFDGDYTDSEANRRDVRRSKPAPAMKPPIRAPSYPPPITTTSPPPNEGFTLQYPELMSDHQLVQGYVPSLNSMFTPPTYPSRVMDSSLLLVSTPEQQQHSSQQLYQNVLPPASNVSPYHAGQRVPSPPPTQHRKESTSKAPRYKSPDRGAVKRSEGPVSVDLKTVYLPRDCLPRFLSIAQVNTTLNRETCGLFLGRDRGGRYVVSTLLIPKQHSTSDTCTMDEEELVLMFTEERGLITLGWIHTHPSQSCFMSSVDLHTHSGFQRMLPESFAVVCAPKSTPNFGVFRLTDPPGLKTVLECTAKEAFHPHPDVPIYTDADKGHVQMKDYPIEIVDLR